MPAPCAASAAVSGMCATSIPLTQRWATQEVKASGLKPDTALLNALIRALGSGGLVKEAQGVFRTMGALHAALYLLAAPPLGLRCHSDVPVILMRKLELQVPLESQPAAAAIVTASRSMLSMVGAPARRCGGPPGSGQTRRRTG